MHLVSKLVDWAPQDAHNEFMINQTTNHFPIAPYSTALEGNTTLLIASCSCGALDCILTAAIMPEQFFTPDGEAATRKVN